MAGMEATFDLLGDQDLLNLISEESFQDSGLTQLFNVQTQQLFNPDLGSGRFEKPVSSSDIKERNESIPKKTRQVNNWANGVWRQWVQFRNAQPESMREPGYPIPEDIGQLDDTMLDFWGQRFVMEVRRQDGKNYPPNTLVQIVSALQRYLRNDCGKPHVNIFKEDDIRFAGFRKALDTKMKELQSQGIGIERRSSALVARDDEMALWNSGVFNMQTATGLSNAVFYYNGKIFGFRGYQEHVDCKAEQFEFGFDNQHGHRYIKYTPRTRKNNPGGLKFRKVSIDPIIHYENKDKDFSLVDLYTKYLSLIPSVGSFYRKPLNGTDENGNPKYSCGTIPNNALKSMIKNFFVEAGINTEGRKITNHSARVTLCTTLYNDRFTDKAVTSRSHHRSSAVHGYQREQFPILKDISNALEPPAALTSTVSKAEASPACPPDVKENIEVIRPTHSTPTMENELVVNLPSCIKRVVLVKPDGRKWCLTFSFY